MYIVIKDGLRYIRFWLTKLSEPFSYKGIEIVQKENTFYLCLKKGYFSNTKEKEQILEYKKYHIKHKELLSDIRIFVYKSDKGINEYHTYENKPFLCAHVEKANIVSNDQYMNGYFLFYNERKLKTNYDCLLLNGKLYENEELKYGDEISYFNLTFYYYDDFLYMNNFMLNNKLERKVFDESLVKYNKERIKENTFYITERKPLEIEELKKYSPIKQINQRKLIFQIGPSLTMSITMVGIAAINIYNSYLNNQPLLNSLIYIMMPVTMLLSGVMWPVLSNASEKRAFRKQNKMIKDEYINYLIGYEKRLEKKINDYLVEENSYFFNGNIDNEKLFYLTNKNSMFLNISIGKTILRKEIDVPEVEDEKIKELINRIIYRLNNIENCPYYVDVKNYKAISFVVKKSKKTELIKRFLLELSINNHYDDFYLAIYSEDLNVFSSFYNLPQLMFNKNRLTLNKKREIQELNSQKLDKPLILLANDKIDFIFSNKEIHLLYFTNDVNKIYKNSDLLIEYLDGKGNIYQNGKTSFTYEDINLPVKQVNNLLSSYQKVSFMNKTVTFKDIYKDFDINKYYLDKQSGLRADFATIGNEILSFDFHESKHGPHGLIGGSTGSGKSELIVSLLLSLCIRYRPDYLNIILIDYKGGGIEESLSYMGKRMPHIIASINNLEQDIFERLVVAIDFECRKRQKLFKLLSNKAMTSIMNIDDYLSNGYEKYDLPKIAHLLIVVDEFAELKKENPEIIKELISFSRIGRSLGLHLILATQRPNGVVDDEIWSNSHFKIALKLFNEKDSNEIIKDKCAAYLNNPGEFYLAVDDNLLKATSIYSKKDVNNGDAYEVALLDNRLDILKRKEYKKETPFTEASYISKKIIEITENLLIKVEKINFYKPSQLNKEALIEKYGNKDEFILGEVDDYLNAKTNILTVNKRNNIFIYSTRDNEINGILNNVSNKTVVIGSKRYQNQFICDSLIYDDVEDIKYLLNKLQKEVERITLIIEDLSCLLSYDETFGSYLYQLLRRQSISNVNIVALSKQSAIGFKLINSFKQKFAIGIIDNQDLLNVFSNHSIYKGKSFFYDDKLISFIPCKEESFIWDDKKYESYISYIPEIIEYQKENQKVLLGYEIKSRNKVLLKGNESLLICSYDEEIIEGYKKLFANEENIKAEVYNKNLLKEERSRYLWIGEGLYNQRLFYVDGKEELKENEAFFWKGNKGKVIRPVVYE